MSHFVKKCVYIKIIKMLKKNVIKGWITSIIGITAMVITLILVYLDKMDFLWDGIAGLSIGTILLMAPQTIEKYFIDLFSKFTGKSSSKNTRQD